MQVKHILIGSRALALRNPVFQLKPDADWDIVSDLQSYLFYPKTEVHSFDITLNEGLKNYTDDLTVEINGITVHVCTLKGLAIVKRSHLWRLHFFDKHMLHYTRFLKQVVPMYNKEDKKYLEERTLATYKYFNERHPNLNQSVEGFFDDYVTKKYNHDWLHELFAHKDKPMYTYMQTDPSKAWCNKSLWDEFTFQEKLWTVAEEASVIATERFLVPQDWNYNSRRAYYNAMQKVCTTLCSGWFRDFALDNYEACLLEYDEAKFLRVKSILNC